MSEIRPFGEDFFCPGSFVDKAMCFMPAMGRKEVSQVEMLVANKKCSAALSCVF